MANCQADCATVDASTLSWFRLQAEGYANGKWYMEVVKLATDGRTDTYETTKMAFELCANAHLQDWRRTRMYILSWRSWSCAEADLQTTLWFHKI
jgi:hypothetical protein